MLKDIQNILMQEDIEGEEEPEEDTDWVLGKHKSDDKWNNRRAPNNWAVPN